ncbi:BIG1-domain-containing protein [Aureobasidium sp. EXF-12298]|nr:BIG1-domain-containing protein [Aureobasidium sp. EXF-12298]KAI4755540.1 BIG1-domain-containing protein [Aureobasidium sp. EXF-12344]KAI4772635.1 BIG1-domain-containing protein [Aureobasidium sp. EXF-3400]
MLLRYLSAAALALQTANAFKDASPFILYSTGQLDAKDVNVNVISAQSLQESVEHQLKGCPSNTYVVVSQPGISTNDLTVSKSTPHLRRRLSGKDDNVKSIFAAKNVVGDVDGMALVASITRECHTKSTLLLDGESTNTDRKTDGEIPTKAYDAIHVRFPSLPTVNDDRESALLQADSYLNSLLATLDSYTVLYATLPNLFPAFKPQHPEQYEMDEPYPSNMHTDLKRDLNTHIVRASNASNPQADLPLFEKYQFLSPGIFMGGVVSILLFSILYVGISAIANLEVSYMAFSKDMGPAAQKKQQQ